MCHATPDRLVFFLIHLWRAQEFWVQFYLWSLKALILLGFYMVELVGIEPTAVA